LGNEFAGTCDAGALLGMQNCQALPLRPQPASAVAVLQLPLTSSSIKGSAQSIVLVVPWPFGDGFMVAGVLLLVFGRSK